MLADVVVLFGESAQRFATSLVAARFLAVLFLMMVGFLLLDHWTDGLHVWQIDLKFGHQGRCGRSLRDLTCKFLSGLRSAVCVCASTAVVVGLRSPYRAELGLFARRGVCEVIEATRATAAWVGTLPFKTGLKPGIGLWRARSLLIALALDRVGLLRRSHELLLVQILLRGRQAPRDGLFTATEGCFLSLLVQVGRHMWLGRGCGGSLEWQRRHDLV